MSQEDVAGVDRVEFLGIPPGLQYYSPDDHAAAIARFAFRIFRDTTAAAFLFPTAAQLPSMTFAVIVGYNGPLSAGTAGNLIQIDLVTSNIVVGGDGHPISFDLAPDPAAGDTITFADLRSIQQGSVAVHSSSEITAQVGLALICAEYDIILTSATNANWFDESSVLRIPPAAFPARPLTNPLYTRAGLDTLTRPTVPVQTSFTQDAASWGPGANATEGVITLGVTINATFIDGFTSVGFDEVVLDASGKPNVWVTLGGHGSQTPYLFATSASGEYLGSPMPVLEGQAALSPTLGGSQPLEYMEDGVRYMRYQTVQVDTLTVIDEYSATVTITVPSNLIQSPALHVVNFTYGVTFASPEFINFINVFPEVAPQPIVFGPTGAFSGVFVDAVSANTADDTPALLVGGSLEPVTVNGGSDGFVVRAFVAGDGVPAAQAQSPLTGAAAAALDIGTVFDIALCPRGITPTPALAAAATPIPLVITEARSVDLALTAATGGGSTASAGVPSLYLVTFATGSAALGSAEDMLPAVLTDPSVPTTTDSTAADVVLRFTPAGESSAVENLAGAPAVPVSVPLQGVMQTSDGAAAPVATISGVIDWSSSAVPPAYRDMLPSGAAISGVQLNAYTDQRVTGVPALAVRRTHPDPGVGGSPTFPSVTSATNGTIVTATSTAVPGGVTSVVDDTAAQLLGLDTDFAVGTMDGSRYYLQYTMTATSFANVGGGGVVNPFPLMVGSPRITTPAGAFYLHADSAADAATPLLLEAGPGATLAQSIAGFSDVFLSVSMLPQANATLIPAEGTSDPVNTVTLILQPELNILAIPGNAEAGFPSAIDATTLSQFAFGVRPVLFTGSDGGGTPADARFGASMPVTASFNNDSGNVELVVGVTASALDALQQYKTISRQTNAYLAVDTAFGGVTLAQRISAPSDAILLQIGTRATLASPKTFIAGAVETEGVVRVLAQHVVLNYGVGLSPAVTPTDTGVLTPGDITAPFYSFATGNTTTANVSLGPITAAGDTPVPLPTNLVTDGTDILMGGIGPVDPSRLIDPATEVAWNGLVDPSTSVINAEAIGTVITVDVALDIPIVVPNTNPLNFLVLNLVLWNAAYLVFTPADLATPISLFGSLEGPGIRVAPTASDREARFALAMTDLSRDYPGSVVEAAMRNVARAVVPAFAGDVGAAAFPATSGELRDLLLAEGTAATVQEGNGEVLTAYHANLVAKHIEIVTTSVSQGLRNPVFANADVSSQDDLTRALSVTPRFE